jgi:RHS repeat-associated protein
MKTRFTIPVGLAVLSLVLASVSSLVDARWYDPESGRFISRDSLQQSGSITAAVSRVPSRPDLLPKFNPYVFCSNNPVRRVDPSGLADEEGGCEDSEDSFDSRAQCACGPGGEGTENNAGPIRTVIDCMTCMADYVAHSDIVFKEEKTVDLMNWCNDQEKPFDEWRRSHKGK